MMTQHESKNDSQPAKVTRRALTFREFVRRQEEHTDSTPPAPSPVPLIDLIDLLMAGAMLFIFISLVLLFLY